MVIVYRLSNSAKISYRVALDRLYLLAAYPNGNFSTTGIVCTASLTICRCVRQQLVNSEVRKERNDSEPKCYWLMCKRKPILFYCRITASSELKTHALTISSCCAHDMGRYSLRVGANETTAELVVQGNLTLILGYCYLLHQKIKSNVQSVI